jgi:hypothetical protein
MAFTTIVAYVVLGAPVAIFLSTQALYLVAGLVKNQYIDY